MLTLNKPLAGNLDNLSANLFRSRYFVSGPILIKRAILYTGEDFLQELEACMIIELGIDTKW